jgi:zinc transport system substrate-binding protein
LSDLRSTKELRVVRRFAAALVLALAVSVTACGSGDAASDGDRPVVVASFYPLAAAAEAVGARLVTVENLTPAGVEPHDLELAPDDLETLLTADAVILVGSGFQPAVEEAAADAEGEVVDVLDGLDTLPPADVDGGEALAADPHVWLDPGLYAAVVGEVADALSEVSPEDAAAFDGNATAYVAELEALDAEFARGLAACDGRTMVVNHAAFGYLAAAYDLRQVAISGLSPEAEPDPARLAELEDLVEREGVTTIFTEELASAEVAETLASEAGVRTAVLSPLEGLSEAQIDAGDDYASVMRDNLEALRTGLGCA